MSFQATTPYRLPPLPPAVDLDDKDILKALLEPHAAIAGLNGIAVNHPNAELIISPAVLRESVASSNIENINTTLADVLQNELFPEAERRAPDKEVLRYRDALVESHDLVEKDEPISTRLIQKIQKTLIPGSAGDYRRQQNRIANDSTSEVLYTPPVPPDVPVLMGDLEKFINADGSALGIDSLLRIIISHYQFEAIHPFNDGNGRTGRIIMVLQMRRYNLLHYPILFVSEFINERRTEYYKRLGEVSSKGNWKEYILFMLQGFTYQALKAQNSLLKMNVLYGKTRLTAKASCKKIYSTDLINSIFQHPVITPGKLAKELDVYHMTASKYLVELERVGILKSKKHGRYHLYINHGLLTLLKQ